MTRHALVTLFALTSSTVSSAHEFWIEPESHRAEPGKVVRMSLKLGERFLGETVIRDESLIDKFVLVGLDGERPVVGRSGAPVSFARTGTPGVSVVAYRSRRRSNELSPQKFDAYLREEGLDAIIPQRAALGESSKPGREVFSRCAKALIRVGENAVSGHDRIVGLPLEIVPETSPFSVPAADELTFRLLFGGQPVEGAKVVFARKDQPHSLRSVKTNADGRATLEGAGSGVWMATALHMIRAPATIDADWESFWASLTFEIPDHDGPDVKVVP